MKRETITFFVTIKNKVYGTVITKPIEAYTTEKARDIAFSMISDDEEVILLTMGI